LDEALLQNAVADVLADDLDLLADEEGEGLGGGSSSSGANGSRTGGGSSDRQEHVLTEAQSFTDLMYSKNKVCRLSWQHAVSFSFDSNALCRVILDTAYTKAGRQPG
jgi:hypothetical protein